MQILLTVSPPDFLNSGSKKKHDIGDHLCHFSHFSSLTALMIQFVWVLSHTHHRPTVLLLLTFCCPGKRSEKTAYCYETAPGFCRCPNYPGPAHNFLLIIFIRATPHPCMYSACQKSWPVIHKFNEKIYKTVSKVYILVDIHRGHSNTSIWSSPPPQYDSFLCMGGLPVDSTVHWKKFRRRNRV